MSLTTNQIFPVNYDSVLDMKYHKELLLINPANILYFKGQEIQAAEYVRDNFDGVFLLPYPMFLQLEKIKGLIDLIESKIVLIDFHNNMIPPTRYLVRTFINLAYLSNGTYAAVKNNISSIITSLNLITQELVDLLKDKRRFVQYLKNPRDIYAVIESFTSRYTARKVCITIVRDYFDGEDSYLYPKKHNEINRNIRAKLLEHLSKEEIENLGCGIILI